MPDKRLDKTNLKTAYVAICEANGITPTIKGFEKAKKLLNETVDEFGRVHYGDDYEAIEFLKQRFDQALNEFAGQWPDSSPRRIHEIATQAFQQLIWNKRR